jgi:hypothetical protein
VQAGGSPLGGMASDGTGSPSRPAHRSLLDVPLADAEKALHRLHAMASAGLAGGLGAAKEAGPQAASPTAPMSGGGPTLPTLPPPASSSIITLEAETVPSSSLLSLALVEVPSPGMLGVIHPRHLLPQLLHRRLRHLMCHVPPSTA